jgi:hypothetical protein
VTAAELLAVLWRDYVATTPQAEAIRYALAARGETVATDHVALRTFALPRIDADALARPFEALGWRRSACEPSQGARRASCWRHDDAMLPRVTISELAIDELSPAAQAVIRALVEQLPAAFAERSDLPCAGRPWRISYADYRALLDESEHAAWVAAFGFRAHHFTADVASLATFPDLVALGAFLVEHGVSFDDSRGAVKGSPSECIEHSATRPDRVAVEFDDATVRVPSCYYELVKRYPPGELRDEAPPSTGANLACPS